MELCEVITGWEQKNKYQVDQREVESGKMRMIDGKIRVRLKGRAL